METSTPTPSKLLPKPSTIPSGAGCGGEINQFTMGNNKKLDGIAGTDPVLLFDIKKQQQQCFLDPAKTWNPDSGLYYARRLAQIKSGAGASDIPVVLPEGFPAKVDPTSSLVWSGQDLVEQEYLRFLEAGDVAEIEAALAHFKGLCLPISGVSRKTFPLPQLGGKIISLASKLYGENNGRGFFILRGFNPDTYSASENVIIYNGIASHIASRKGRQDEKNNYLLHLIDLGSKAAPDSVRQAPYSNVPQPFHTDTADILSLYCLCPAAKGGRTLLASSWNTYNRLTTSQISLLANNNWAFDSFGRSGVAYTMRPLLHSIPTGEGRRNRVLLSFSRRPLTGSPVSPRTPAIPELTSEQSDVLDTVHFVAAAHAVKVGLQKGDLMFWNNFALLHAREGFEDEGENRRHLIRMWLRDDTRAEEWGGIPEVLGDTWEEAFEGGEEVWGIQKWPVEPIEDYEFVTEQRRSSGYA